MLINFVKSIRGFGSLRVKSKLSRHFGQTSEFLPLLHCVPTLNSQNALIHFKCYRRKLSQ